MALQQPSEKEMGRDPSAHARDKIAPAASDDMPRIGAEDDRDYDLEADLLNRSKVICNATSTSDLTRRRGEWARAYRAYNNQHLVDSKYKSPAYRTRSKNFVPKTRQAVKKNMVAAAAALFGASDAVSVTAENDADPGQQASAVINQELLNYRLDRTNLRAGVSWFPICMGQLQTTRITGVCFSKQFWEYEEILVPATEKDLLAFAESLMEPPAQPILPEMGPPAPAGDGGMGGASPMPPGPPPPDMMADMPPEMGPPPLAGPPPGGGGMPDMMMGMGGGMPPMGPGPGMPPTGPPGADMPPDLMGGAPPPMQQAAPPAPPQPVAKPPKLVKGIDGRWKRVKVIRDRPRVRMCKPEHAIIDIAGDWEDIVQEGEYFIMMWPMRIGQIRRMQKKGRQSMGGGQWLPTTDSALKTAVEEYSATQVTQARGRGTDPQATANQPSLTDYDIVWVHENFIRGEDGIDYHFWSLGTHSMLSIPGPTEDHYPAHQGERPYVMGLGEIEAFSPIPMSMVESIQPQQNEANDIRNLTIDTLKQGIAPMAVYKRAQDIDLRALKERGPDATIGVGNMDDLRFEKPPGPDPASFHMHDRLTIEIDESAGSFSTSSVNNNRAAGETVGGMKLISNSANAVQEYDLRVFTETYVERVLRHLIMLEQHYETDETILALVGERAEVYQRFGVNEPIDELLTKQVTLKVNAGVGSTDPMMKLQKFGAALEMGGKVAPFVKGQVEVKGEEIYGEIFAAAGYKAERFFNFTSPEEAAKNAQPDPETMKAKADLMKAEADAKKTEIESNRLMLEGARTMAEQEERRNRFGFEVDQFDRGQANTDREFDEKRRVADRDFEHQRETGGKDFALRANAQNKQLTDQATAEAEQMLTPHGAREPLPVEGVLQQGVQMMLAALAQLAQSQQQQTEALAQIAMGQQRTQDILSQLVAQQQRPTNGRVRRGMNMKERGDG